MIRRASPQSHMLASGTASSEVIHQLPKHNNRTLGYWKQHVRNRQDFAIFLKQFSQLFQLCVLRLRSDENRNIRVGVFPERKEILIGRLGFGGVALHGKGTGELEMRECSDG